MAAEAISLRESRNRQGLKCKIDRRSDNVPMAGEDTTHDCPRAFSEYANACACVYSCSYSQ